MSRTTTHGPHTPSDIGPPRRTRAHQRAPAPLQPPVAAASETPKVDVGQALRRLRGERDLSIRALAESSGLAVNTLSLIENGKSSPSVSTLQVLAQALRVPIAAFFETDEPKSELVYIAAENRPRATFAHGTLEDLGAGLSERTISPLVVTLEPGADSGAQPIVHTGDELVFCLAGRIAYCVDGRTFHLAPGDSLMFAAYLPHSWRNVDPAPSRALLVLCPSNHDDRPTERHFAPRAAPPRPREIG